MIDFRRSLLSMPADALEPVLQSDVVCSKSWYGRVCSSTKLWLFYGMIIKDNESEPVSYSVTARAADKPWQTLIKSFQIE
jgi:hypothetical protein